MWGALFARWRDGALVRQVDLGMSGRDVARGRLQAVERPLWDGMEGWHIRMVEITTRVDHGAPRDHADGTDHGGDTGGDDEDEPLGGRLAVAALEAWFGWGPDVRTWPLALRRAPLSLLS